jgi:hypothetical protein
MHIKTHAEAMEEFSKLMEPCFGENPTSGAAVVIVGEKSVAYIVVNMSGFEVVHTLHTAADSLMAQMGVSPASETMQ